MLRISSIDSESKQRFLRLSRRIQSGQLSEPLKCPKTVEFRPVLILKLASKSLFRWYGDELCCATTSKLVDQLIVQLVQDGFCEVSGS